MPESSSFPVSVSAFGSLFTFRLRLNGSQVSLWLPLTSIRRRTSISGSTTLRYITRSLPVPHVQRFHRNRVRLNTKRRVGSICIL